MSWGGAVKHYQLGYQEMFHIIAKCKHVDEAPLIVCTESAASQSQQQGNSEGEGEGTLSPTHSQSQKVLSQIS